MSLLEITNPEVTTNVGLIYNIIAIITTGLITWILTIARGNHEIKKIKVQAEENNKTYKLQIEENNKKYTERDALIAEEIRGLSNKMVALSMDFLEYKKKSEFKSRLMNAMRTMATNIIDFNVDLKPLYKHLCMQMAREFEDFALRFYYSDMRGISHEIAPYLRIDMDSRISKFEAYAQHLDTKDKIFKYSTGKKVILNFQEYLNNSKLKNIIDVLLMVLEKNGLNEDQVIEKFEEFMGKFFKEFIRLIHEWEELDDTDE